MNRTLHLIAVQVLVICGLCVSSLVGAETITRDAVGRILQVDHGDGTLTTYSYDASGNRLSRDRIDNRRTIAVTVDPPNSGTITGDGPTFFNTPASLSASPAGGFIFHHWSESGVTIGTDPVLPTFIVSASRNLTALFVPLAPEIVIEDPSTTPATDLVDGVSPLFFGSQLLQSTTSKTLTVRNIGNAPLTDLILTVDGAASTDFSTSTLPSSIAAGGNATLTIQFIPTALGSLIAALHIASNDTDENPFDIGLAGTGTALAASYSTGTEVPLTANGFTATGKAVTFSLNYAPTVGTQLMVVNNASLGFINGTFNGLAQGQAVALSFGGNTYNFVANYFGGTGNDLVLVWKSNRAFAWGRNEDGQLGDNSTTPHSLPMPVTATGVLNGKTVVSVSSGLFHSLALCSDGTVAAWGDNTFGQLDYYHEGGSKSLVYGLASRGAGRLRRDLDMPFERMDWTTRNKQRHFARSGKQLQ